MARTIFITKESTNIKIEAEQTVRAQVDAQLDSRIGAQATNISSNGTELARLNGLLVDEEGIRNAQIGTMAFPGLLKSDGNSPNTISEAITAVVDIKNNVQTSLNTIDFEAIDNLKADISILRTAVNADNARLNAILLSSNIDYDSFAEIVNLITTKDTQTAASLAALETSLQTLIDAKMDKVQTSQTALEYVDEQDATKKYKIVIVDGQLALDSIDA